MSDIQLIIFDCDGVLIDSEAISVRVLVEELANLGVHIDEQTAIRDCVGRSLVDVAGSYGIGARAGEFERFAAAVQTSLLAHFAAELQPMPHIHSVVENLAVPACVATSSNPERALNSLAITGLDVHFAGKVFTTCQVKHGKPAPDLFLYAAQQMGVAPQACLVIEDSVPGLRAAQAAHMPVWQFTGGSHLKNLQPAQIPPPQVPTFDNWADFFALDPNLQQK
ncbi:HAD family hydrolase [Pararhodobacter oceanensis]|uniref:HAD family hydrolase n=1 Tax=Pararhodobacter oceanensis TaxID=2172121 RepID=UPI003A8FDA8C